jgi:tetratricopeptide (TPR) repeat protein
VEGAGAYGQAMRDGHAAAWAARWREAVGHYRTALAAIPDDATARTSLAAALVHAGQPHDALGLYEQLALERAEDTALMLRVAELRQRVGRVDDADRAYLEVAEKYLVAGQREKAIGVWRRLVLASGHRAETMSAVAGAALAAGVDDIGEEARRAAAAAAPAPAARAEPAATASVDAGDWIGRLAARLREAGAPVRWDAPALRGLGLGSSPPAPPRRPRAGAAALDDALSLVASSPPDGAGGLQLGRALVETGAREAGRRQLADVADLAELSGELGLAAEVTAELLSTADDPLPLYRRIARLALLGEAVEVAAGAHVALSDELSRRGDAGAALVEARRARAVAPVSADAQASAADRLAALGAPDEADEARRRAFQLAPRAARHVAGYMASSARHGAIEELLLASEALVDLEPDADLAVRLAGGELRGSAPAELLARGLLLAWAGAADADDALRRAADAAAPVGPVAAAAFAERALATDRPAEAAGALRRWVHAEPPIDSPDDRARLAGFALTAAERSGDEELAVASLAVLVECSPEDGTLGSLYAERLAAAGRPVDAARELARLAGLARGRGDLHATAALLESAATLDPANVEHALAAAALARDRGDREQARRLYLAAAEAPAAPGGDAERVGAAVSALLAAADLSAGSVRVEILRRAIALASTDPEPRRRLVHALVGSGQVGLAGGEAAQLAELLLRQGDRDGAGVALDDARRLDPWNPALAALREALGR